MKQQHAALNLTTQLWRGKMTLYEKWVRKAYNQKGQWEKKVWDVYLPVEQKIYEYFLANKINTLNGTVEELSRKFNMDEVFFTGFLDGINGALDEIIDITQIDKNSTIALQFGWDNLYKKMVEYKAEHLFRLPQWSNIFTEDQQEKLYIEQKSSKTIVNATKIGRNEQCPCGSGKKYKKCCGA